MAINGIITARDARVVAGELKRLSGNLSMYVLLAALGGQDVTTGREVLGGLDRFGDLLLSVSSGKKDTDEVFLPEGSQEAADKAIKEMFGK